MPRKDNENQYIYGAYDYRTQNEDNQRHQEEERQKNYERQLALAQEEQDERRRQEERIAEDERRRREIEKESYSDQESEYKSSHPGAAGNTGGGFRSAIPALSMLTGVSTGLYAFSNTDSFLKAFIVFFVSAIVSSLAFHAIYHVVVIGFIVLKYALQWTILAALVIGAGLFFDFAWAESALNFILKTYATMHLAMS